MTHAKDEQEQCVFIVTNRWLKHLQKCWNRCWLTMLKTGWSNLYQPVVDYFESKNQPQIFILISAPDSCHIQTTDPPQWPLQGFYTPLWLHSWLGLNTCTGVTCFMSYTCVKTVTKSEENIKIIWKKLEKRGGALIRGRALITSNRVYHTPPGNYSPTGQLLVRHLGCVSR